MSGQPGWPDNFSAGAMRAHTEASLKRLGVEALDLTQLHCVPADVLKRGEVFEWLRLLQKEGKIRHFGASVESMQEAMLCVRQEGLVSLQIILNALRQKPLEQVLPAADETGVAIIARVPLASGLLSGRYTAATTFGPDDHRTFNRRGEAFDVGETFAGVPYEVGLEAVERLRPLVPAGATMAQFALRWIVDLPQVTVVIPGARNAEQARGNAAAADLVPLDEQVRAAIREVYDDLIRPHVHDRW